jgi:pimeloyl-ACP methyl ester carboxylesterase
VGDGDLGKTGVVPGWPGDGVFPAQPMVWESRNVLERYHAAGGRVQMEIFEGSGHAPLFEASERWNTRFLEFLASI